MAVALGALHALSPGHGKTVMAAYLVGSRGNDAPGGRPGHDRDRVAHARRAGSRRTEPVGGAIIPPERLYPILSVVSGAIVIVIGGYLLLNRTMSCADRAPSRRARPCSTTMITAMSTSTTPRTITSIGHEHERRATAGWHEHDGMGHTHLPQEGMGKRGLFALGLSGGMIPSVSALLILIGSISIGRPEFGIVLTIAFGLGMAFVLVGIGLALVYARGFVERLSPRAASLRLSEPPAARHRVHRPRRRRPDHRPGPRRRSAGGARRQQLGPSAASSRWSMADS